MKCEKCGLNDANTVIRQTVNGNTKRWNLCNECALKDGLSIDLNSLWGSLLTGINNGSKLNVTRCEKCGNDFMHISKSGKVGCPACYTTFSKQLEPSIQRIHGATKHVGKHPKSAGEGVKNQYEIDRLHIELNKLIAKQEYEKCAEIRDKITQLEKEMEEKVRE